LVNFHQLHHDPDQWQQHDKFIPERFDHKSPFYLKPNGQKRHPQAFSPFLGGKRICIGKTFAEIVVKLVVIGLVGKLNFEFADPTMKEKEKPILNVDMEV
jgi:cytochrome P450